MAILNSYVKLPEGIASSDPFVGTSKRLLPILRAIFSGSLFELRNVARSSRSRQRGKGWRETNVQGGPFDS